MTPARRAPTLVFAIVSMLALLRQPMHFLYEEPSQFWDEAGSFGPAGGYLQVFARLAFLVAHPFGEYGVFATRIMAALVIGAVAAYLASDALEKAIPSRGARLALALSLPLFPVVTPWDAAGPYLGPLNSQWWIALAVLGIALAEPRRWHMPFLALAGLTGVAPCVALPAFRDRRGLALLAATAVQGLVYLDDRATRPFAVNIEPEYLLLVVAVLGSMIASRLPLRTQLAFSYLGLAHIALGGFMNGVSVGNERYLAAAFAAVALGIAATVLRKVQRIDLGVSDAPGRRRGGTGERAIPDSPAVLLEDA